MNQIVGGLLRPRGNLAGAASRAGVRGAVGLFVAAVLVGVVVFGLSRPRVHPAQHVEECVARGGHEDRAVLRDECERLVRETPEH